MMRQRLGRLHRRRTKHQKPNSRYYLNSIEILLDTEVGRAGPESRQGRQPNPRGEATIMPIIEARGLARTFTSRKRTVHAVRGVDLTVEPGEIVGFLGPNGAGKTTTLRMLTTLLEPTAGTAIVAGADLRRDPLEVRRRIGYVPQAIGQTMGGTDPECLVSEELLDQAALYRIPKAAAAARAELLIRQLDLGGLGPAAGQDPVRRAAAAAGDRARPGPRAAAGLPRRADDRRLTRRAGRTCGSTSAACGPTWAPPSSSPRTTWTRRTRSATGCSSSTTA